MLSENGGRRKLRRLFENAANDPGMSGTHCCCYGGHKVKKQSAIGGGCILEI